MVEQHALVGEQPARDALGVVEPVHAHQDAHAAVAPDRLGLGRDGGIVGQGRRSAVASTPIGKTPSRTSRPGSCTRSISTECPRMSVSEVAKCRR